MALSLSSYPRARNASHYPIILKRALSSGFCESRPRHSGRICCFCLPSFALYGFLQNNGKDAMAQPHHLKKAYKPQCGLSGPTARPPYCAVGYSYTYRTYVFQVSQALSQPRGGGPPGGEGIAVQDALWRASRYTGIPLR